MTTRVWIATLSSLFLWACASDARETGAPMNAPAGSAGSASTAQATSTPMASPVISADETWTDGKMIPANVDIDIASGAKVQIAPGAMISVAPGASITVHGSLAAASKDDHVKLSGSNWKGIVVAGGGSLALQGVDIEGAKVAIQVNAGNVAAAYDYGTITGGSFKVDANATLTTDHAAFKQGGFSFVSGTLNASFLDYSGAGIALGDANAEVFVADSKISGVGGDFFTANGGKLLHVEYTTIDNTHCPFHFNAISKFEIDHVTTGGMATASTSAYGLMLYNADAGPHTISYSNFYDPSWEQTRPTAVINVTNTFIRNVSAKAGQVTFMPADSNGNNAHTTPNTDALPRGMPGPG